jgi:hypothetical protein
MARGLVRAETGYVRTARPYEQRRPVTVRPPGIVISGTAVRSRHRLRCRLDAMTGPGPIGSARPNPPSCQRRSPPSARPAHTPVRTGASRLPACHAERSQLPGKTGSARCSCAARCSSPVSFIRSIRLTRSKTLAAVRLSADNDLGKHAAGDLSQTVALIRVPTAARSGSSAGRSGWQARADQGDKREPIAVATSVRSGFRRWAVGRLVGLVAQVAGQPTPRSRYRPELAGLQKLRYLMIRYQRFRRRHE